MEALIALLNAIMPLSNALEGRLRQTIRRKVFKAGDLILREGEICSHIFFIEKGVVRIFNQKEIREITTWILKELDIFVSVDSFFGQVPSDEYIEAREEVIVFGITYQQLEDICTEFPEFKFHWAAIQTEYYRRFDRWQKWITTLTPTQRYQEFKKAHSDLLYRIPQKIICSYLMISKATLGRIRKYGSSGRT